MLLASQPLRTKAAWFWDLIIWRPRHGCGDGDADSAASTVRLIVGEFPALGTFFGSLMASTCALRPGARDVHTDVTALLLISY